MHRFSLLLFMLITVMTSAKEIFVFGPGGPAPAMTKAGDVFFQQTGIKVNIIAGPTSKWSNNAMKSADLIFSGSEIMLDDFIKQFQLAEYKALYLRPSAILVRKNNPKKIKGINSLIALDINIMVVQGAGQVGLWEDLVGRTKNITSLNKFRKNIKFIAPNSAEALAKWNSDSSIDAWIIWNHWLDKAGASTELVKTENEYTIYRATSIGFTEKGSKNKNAQAFYEFLDSKTAIQIFDQFGWKKQW